MGGEAHRDQQISVGGGEGCQKRYLRFCSKLLHLERRVVERPARKGEEVYAKPQVLWLVSMEARTVRMRAPAWGR